MITGGSLNVPHRGSRRNLLGCQLGTQLAAQGKVLYNTDRPLNVGMANNKDVMWMMEKSTRKIASR